MRTKGNSVGDTEFGCRETVRLIAFFVAFLHTLTYRLDDWTYYVGNDLPLSAPHHGLRSRLRNGWLTTTATYNISW